MKNTPILIIATMLVILFICFSGCQEQTNQNGNNQNNNTTGNQTGNTTNETQQHNTTQNKFLGNWEVIDIAPNNETWVFYANLTAKNILTQIFDGEPSTSISWFDYTNDTTTLCFSTNASPDTSDYFSICYTYLFSQNATRLTLSSNGIIIIDLVKLSPE
jgi:hypothetical protein